MEQQKLLILGGDRRMAYTASYLTEWGYRVCAYANSFAENVCGVKRMSGLCEAMDSCDNIIMGIPFTRDGSTMFAPFCDEVIRTDDILDLTKPRHSFAVGNPGGFLTSCTKRGARCVDYGQREDFALYNAVPTAEAILALLINNLPVTIWDSSILILGYGRIGKALASMLKKLGADVTASARKAKDFAMMDTAGVNSITTGHYGGLDSFDAVVNTIPCVTADEGFYVQLDEGTVIIDASSAPGYMDRRCAERHGLTLIEAFGLPGKTAPATSGRIIAKAVTDIFRQI